MIKRFVKHIKEGFIGVKRNLATSISTISAITVTLTIIGLFIVVIINLDNIAKNIEGDLRISVLVDSQYEEEIQLNRIEESIRLISGVGDVEFSSKDQELAYFLSLYEEDRELYMPDGADNPMPHTFYVEVIDAQDISGVDFLINEIEGISETNYGGQAITTLIDMINNIRYGGLFSGLLLTFLTIYLVQNTIQLTILSRKREIWIMRTVGARNWFIIAPYIVEGIILGIFGSLIPILLISISYITLYDITEGVLLSNLFELINPYPFIFILSLALLVISLSVGAIGSIFSVRKNLRWKR